MLPPAGLHCCHAGGVDVDVDVGSADGDDHTDNADNDDDYRNLTIPVMTQKCSSTDEERCEVRQKKLILRSKYV